MTGARRPRSPRPAPGAPAGPAPPTPATWPAGTGCTRCRRWSAPGATSLTLGILVLVPASSPTSSGNNDDLITDLVVVGIVLVAGVISWLVTRWQVADGVLRIETGLIRRQSRRFPLSQVQAIDVVQTGLARVLGLAELRLRMAGADSSGGRLACLPLADAERLREQLLAMGQRRDAGRRAGAASRRRRGRRPVRARPGRCRGPGQRGRTDRPERVLFRVQSERLAGAIMLSRTGAYAGTAIAAVIAVIALTGQPGIIVPFLSVGDRDRDQRSGASSTASSGPWSPTAPDGLRLRSGLMQTAAETIRPGTGAGRAPGRAAVLARVRLVPARGGRRRAAPAAGEPLRGAAPARAHPGRVARRRGPDARRAADRAAAAHPARRPPARAGRRRCPITSWRGTATTATWWPRAAGCAARRPGFRWRRCRASAGCRARCSAGSGSPRSGSTLPGGG